MMAAMPVRLFRTFASLITAVGLAMLGSLLVQWTTNFMNCEGGCGEFITQLLLALPIPLHVIFIGLIIQKKWLPEPWHKPVWVGITGSGIWLGISLAMRTFWL